MLHPADVHELSSQVSCQALHRGDFGRQLPQLVQVSPLRSPSLLSALQAFPVDARSTETDREDLIMQSTLMRLQQDCTSVMLGTGGKFMFHQYGPSSEADEMCCFATTNLGVLQIPAPGRWRI